MPRLKPANCPSAAEILPLGQDGALVRFAIVSSPAATGAVQAFKAAIQAADLPGVTQTATSLASVLVRFDPAATTRAAINARLAALLEQRDWMQAEMPAVRRTWSIPVAFGGDTGPQLDEAAALAGLTPQQAVDELTTADLRVLAIGFAPGQPYVGLLPERWDMPRQPQLTPQVPAGALIVAVRQLVLFTNPNATGWRHIGQSGFRPFSDRRADPFALQQGDAIRLIPVSASEIQTLTANQPDGLGGAHCTVVG